MGETGETKEKGSGITRRDLLKGAAKIGGGAVAGVIGATVVGEGLRRVGQKEEPALPAQEKQVPTEKGDIHEELNDPESGFRGMMDFSSPLLRENMDVKEMLSSITRGDLHAYTGVLSGNPEVAKEALSIIANKRVEAIREIQQIQDLPPIKQEALGRIAKQLKESVFKV